MTKHKHADMIKAKADNMELVVFVKNINTGEWWEVFGDLPFNQQQDFFLCLPQHKEACLHWLNGGEVEVKYQDEYWKPVCNNDPVWRGGYFMMRDFVEYRIKPRKDKRWIGYCASRNQTFPHPQDSLELAENYAMSVYSYPIGDWQFIEIEVEV